jgi:hypothetical protein
MTTRRKIVMQRGGFPMNALNRPGIYAGFTSLVLMSALAAPAIAQTKTFPPGTDCSALGGADMTACQSQQATQQRDGTVGNGGTPVSPPANNGIGAGNQVVPNAANPTGGNANSSGPVNGLQNAPSGQNGQNGTTGTPNANTDNTSNP